MRSSVFIFCLVLAIISCNTKKNTVVNDNSNFGAITKSIIETTKSYLSKGLQNPKISYENNGGLNISGDGVIYRIASSDINFGLIDEDSTPDAIVSYEIIPEGKAKYRKHLLMLNKGEMKVIKDFASEMIVMQISNRVVFAEIPKYGSNSPLHTCNECKDHVKYKLSGDSLQLFK
jgi:hypothetical protein